MLSTRCHYTIQMTNMWRDSVTPSWDHGTTKFRGTARQILAEYETFKRVSGGCNIACCFVDADGYETSSVSLQRLRDAVDASDFGADYQKQQRRAFR